MLTYLAILTLFGLAQAHTYRPSRPLCNRVCPSGQVLDTLRCRCKAPYDIDPLIAIDPRICPQISCPQGCSSGFEIITDDKGCNYCGCRVEKQVCAPVLCRMYCPYGWAKDESTGCDVCKCQEKPACRPVLCDMYCLNGWAQDENGCDVCRCRSSRFQCPPTPVCRNLCLFGRVNDSNGCPTCQCLPEVQTPRPQCPGLCRNLCPFGRVYDSNGCPTCQCREDPYAAKTTVRPRVLECGPVCANFCQFGRVLDSRGCPTCTCKSGRLIDYIAS